MRRPRIKINIRTPLANPTSQLLIVTRTLYGIIFPGESEAAFSNYRLWESLGFIVAYVGSTTTCIGTKTSNIIVSLVFGILGYYVVEIMERWDILKRDKDGKVIRIDELILSKIKGAN